MNKKKEKTTKKHSVPVDQELEKLRKFCIAKKIDFDEDDEKDILQVYIDTWKEDQEKDVKKSKKTNNLKESEEEDEEDDDSTESEDEDDDEEEKKSSKKKSKKSKKDEEESEEEDGEESEEEDGEESEEEEEDFKTLLKQAKKKSELKQLRDNFKLDVRIAGEIPAIKKQLSKAYEASIEEIDEEEVEDVDQKIKTKKESKMKNKKSKSSKKVDLKNNKEISSFVKSLKAINSDLEFNLSDRVVGKIGSKKVVDLHKIKSTDDVVGGRFFMNLPFAEGKKLSSIVTKSNSGGCVVEEFALEMLPKVKKVISAAAANFEKSKKEPKEEKKTKKVKKTKKSKK